MIIVQSGSALFLNRHRLRTAYTDTMSQVEYGAIDEPHKSAELIDLGEDSDFGEDYWELSANSGLISNVVLGVSDGSTVPFALAAGLASATEDSSIVTRGVIAELAAGCIAMGLGGYMADQAERVHARTQRQIFIEALRKQPEAARDRLHTILSSLAVSDNAVNEAHERLLQKPSLYADFILTNEAAKKGIGDLEENNADDDRESRKAAAAVGFSYVIAGAIPTVPYLFVPDSRRALFMSVVIGIVALLIFGALKATLVGANRFKSALQTAGLGAFAAATSYFLSRYFE